MAKSRRASVPGVKEAPYKYPSRFGSHRSMVVEENSDGTVICEDEFGFYTTFANRLDNGCADPKRYEVSRLSRLFASSEKAEKKVKAKA